MAPVSEVEVIERLPIAVKYLRKPHRKRLVANSRNVRVYIVTMQGCLGKMCVWAE